MNQTVSNKKKGGRLLIIFGSVLLVALLVCLFASGGFSAFFGNSTAPTLSPEQLANDPTISNTAEFLPSVPESLIKHVYLDYRGKGFCESFTGDVLIMAVLVNDPEALWSDDQIDAIKAGISNTVERIRSNAAAYGADVNLTVDYTVCTASEVLNKDDHSNWVNSALTSAGLPDIYSINSVLEQQRNVQAAPVVFITNREGRSSAYPRTTLIGQEYCIIYEDTTPLYHELCHLFGAKDFYYPDSVADLADKYLPDSIMVNSGSGIMDSLTAYLIGWTDTLSSEALSFLQETSHLTYDYLNAEREKNSHTGYVTDFQIGSTTYTGYLMDGYLHGTGSKTKNGATWEGNWEYGELNGYGSYTNENGNAYVGEFLNSTMHGIGTYIWPNGDSYTGSWINGKRSGAGTYTWANGNSYTGNFDDGERNGQGTFTWASGGVYSGNWLEGNRNGFGKMEYANGSIYEGDWENDKRSGTGKLSWPSGDYYEGEWVDDARTGLGKYCWASGSVYEGQWLNNMRHGSGTYTSATGVTRSGIWENDEFIG